MTETERRVPELRFKGFVDDWEQRKLIDVADIFGGGTPSTTISDYWDGEIDWYSPVEIGEQVYVNGSQKKLTELGLKKSSAKVLPVGTVLFTSRAGIGKTAILAKEGATNQGFQSIVPHKNALDSYFIYSRTNELKRYGEIQGAGSTFVEVSGKQMAKMPILIPILEEQIKIGGFFKQLDNTIALHQRQLNNYKQQKKYMLQKMFPKDGEKVPEVRFDGFTEEWEQCNLGDVAMIKTGYPFNSEDFDGSGKYLVITNGNIQNDLAFVDNSLGNRIDVSDTVLLNNYELNIGDVLVTMDGTVGRTAKVICSNQIIAQRVGRLIAKDNSEFLYQSLNTGDFSKEMKKVSHGGTIKHISLTEISDYAMFVPATVEEQTKIGAFFKHLDDATDHHQQKVNGYQQLKNAMLQQMFV